MPQQILVNGQTVEFPDGMSQDDMVAAIKKNALAIPPASASGAPASTATVQQDPNSPAIGGWDNIASGLGMGMAKVGRGISNGIRALGPEYNASADFFGLPGPADSADAKKLDAPLAATTGGKFGNFVGQTALAAPMMLVPGANTYPGMAIAGALFGGAAEDGDAMDRAKAALTGGVGGLVGKGTGDALGAGFNYLSNASIKSAADATAAAAGKNAAITTAQGAGYVLPPSDASPGVINTILQGISGKVKTAQTASQRNQLVTNDLVKDQFGLPPDQPITPAALSAVRANAGKAYDAVGSVGTVGTTPAYDAALDAIAAPYTVAAAGFPNAKVNPIVSTIDSLRTPGFDAASGLAKIAELRGAANTAYAGGDKQTGGALKSAADAIEDAIDTHLTASGASPDLLQNFRNARQTIAQTYTAEKALNLATGDINAQSLGARVLAGKPLTGGMATAGQVAASFPKAMQPLKEVPNQVSPLDIAVSTLGNGALLMARPAVRSVILSKPYQSLMASPPNYSPSSTLGLLGDLTNNTVFPRALGVMGTGGLLSLPANQ